MRTGPSGPLIEGVNENDVLAWRIASKKWEPTPNGQAAQMHIVPVLEALPLPIGGAGEIVLEADSGLWRFDNPINGLDKYTLRIKPGADVWGLPYSGLASVCGFECTNDAPAVIVESHVNAYPFRAQNNQAGKLGMQCTNLFHEFRDWNCYPNIELAQYVSFLRGYMGYCTVPIGGQYIFQDTVTEEITFAGAIERLQMNTVRQFNSGPTRNLVNLPTTVSLGVSMLNCYAGFGKLLNMGNPNTGGAFPFVGLQWCQSYFEGAFTATDVPDGGVSLLNNKLGVTAGVSIPGGLPNSQVFARQNYGQFGAALPSSG